MYLSIKIFELLFICKFKIKLFAYDKSSKESLAMTIKHLCSVSLFSLFFIIYAQNANAEQLSHDEDMPQNQFQSAKGANARTLANSELRNLKFSKLGQDYTDFKNFLAANYGINYSLDISYMGQRAAPNGKKNAMQTYISPSITWNMFDNEYGQMSLNAGYSIVRYGGISAATLGRNIGAQTEINDSNTPDNTFSELYLTYQLGGDWDWLSLGLGQFPLSNFDASNYDSNQQINFINTALAQNASSSYSSAGVGMYAQIAPSDDWSFSFGAQDATNVDAPSVQFDNFGDEHYTTFASLSYHSAINGLGNGQYSILLYNQPAVEQQPETTNGWSLNMSQNIGEKFAVFGRINGVSGHTEPINQSYVLGAVYNDPLERNPLDQIGFAFAYNKIDEKAVGSKLTHNSEKIIEGYWAWGVSKWMTITPDVQFYIDPALNHKSDYATVFSLRTTLFF